MKINMTIQCILSFLLITLWLTCGAQFSMQPIDLPNQIQSSDLVVEGEVISRRYLGTKSKIFTAYQVQVTKVFKGDLDSDVIEIIGRGGRMDDVIMKVSPSVQLSEGNVATFMLVNLKPDIARCIPKTQWREHMYNCYANLQSVFHYDLEQDQVRSAFSKVDGLESSWYEQLVRITGHDYKQLQMLQKKSKVQSRFVPSISTLSPTTITAGTFSELTISGNGFGASQGGSRVKFKRSNDGGASYHTTSVLHTISWSNTMIKVMVPFEAGTGQVQVTVGGSTTTSSGSITVPYSANTFEDAGNLIRLVHANVSGTGGYEFKYFTDFNNNGAAVASFERALKRWQCAEVNFTVNGTTTADSVGFDFINVVRFDNGSELDPGVLGEATIFFGCYAASIQRGPAMAIDIVFNDGTNWEYGPALPSGSEFDFESVALHELGHASLQGHVIDPSKVMHYSTDVGLHNRTLGSDNFDAADYIYSLSTPYNFSGCTGVSGAATRFNLNLMAICQDVTVTLDGNLEGTLTAADVDNGSSSHCGVSVTIGGDFNYNCTDVGTTNVTLTVTDQGGTGRSASCSSQVTIRENEPPVAQCLAGGVTQLDATGHRIVEPDFFENGSDDNCQVTNQYMVPAQVDTSDIGVLIAQYVVEDGSGNQDMCTGNLKVIPYSTTLYVDSSATTGLNRGDSWSHALTNLQDALAVLNVGVVDTIKIAKGTYYPDDGTGITNNDRDATFFIHSGIVLLGGYPSGGGDRDLSAHQTILSGDIDHNDSKSPSLAPNDIVGNNAYTVVFSLGATVNGCTITAGLSDGSGSRKQRGGGIYTQGTNAYVDCMVVGNYAPGTGSDGLGAGIYHLNGTTTFTNCLIAQNTATSSGGGFNCAGGTPNLINCTVVYNTSGGLQGGVGAHNANLTLTNSVVWGNVPNQLFVSAGGSIAFSYSDIQGPLPTGSAYIDGGGNITANPLFIDSTDIDGLDNIFGSLDDGYSLTLTSPAINASNPSTVSPTTDIKGDERFGVFDMGAYESTKVNFMIISTGIKYAKLIDAVNAALPGDTIMQIGDSIEVAPLEIPIEINFISEIPFVLEIF